MAVDRWTLPPWTADSPLLPVHPLVVGLAAKIVGQQELYEAIADAQRSVGYVHPETPSDNGVLPNDDINMFGTQPQSDDIVTLAGYLGGCLIEKDPKTGRPPDFKYPEQMTRAAKPGERDKAGTDLSRWWQILFLNATVSKWLVVAMSDILLHNRMNDDTAAFGERDVLWVKADAKLGQGGTSISSEARFLTGGFVRAGELEASLAPLAVSNDSGLLCEAITPGCCTVKSRTRAGAPPPPTGGGALF
jgi:hypothetical protein